MSSVLLFAAGKGTRMRPLTEHTPKPLVKVGPITLLDHALSLTQIPSIKTRVINTHYKADMLHEHVKGLGVEVSHEEELLETGGGFMQALPLLVFGAMSASQPVFTLNTDAVWRGRNPLTFLQKHWRDEMDALLLLVPKSNVQGHTGGGDFTMNMNGQLSRGAGHVYSGVQLIRTDRLPRIEERCFSMNKIWDHFLERKSIFGAVYSGLWCDVGSVANIALGCELLECCAGEG